MSDMSDMTEFHYQGAVPVYWDEYVLTGTGFANGVPHEAWPLRRQYVEVLNRLAVAAGQPWRAAALTTRGGNPCAIAFFSAAALAAMPGQDGWYELSPDQVRALWPQRVSLVETPENQAIIAVLDDLATQMFSHIRVIATLQDSYTAWLAALDVPALLAEALADG